MQTPLGLLGTLLCCASAVADDAAGRLAEHLGKKPALVVVVCASDEQDLPTVAGLVDETPWTVLCRTAADGPLAKIRQWAAEKGLLGERVYVVDARGDSLWLADDMADAVWLAPGSEG